MGYKFDPKKDWHKSKIPLFHQMLSAYQDVPSKFIEIGSLEGRSATWLLDNILVHPESHLTCIDPCLDECHSNLHHNLSSHVESKKCRIMVEGSEAALPKLLHERDQCSHDFVYIDGMHHSECVLRDAVMAFLLIKVGGIIAFDDYNWKRYGAGGPWTDAWSPKLAIDSFLAVHEGSLEVLWKGYQVWVRKTEHIPKLQDGRID